MDETVSRGMRLRIVRLIAALAVVLLPFTAHAGWKEGHAAFAKRDYATAMREWLPLAREGDAEAQLNVAFMYNQGLGVPIDPVIAAEWYLRAAEQGLAEAQAQLAVAYIHGSGVQQNYAEALKWSQRAADKGHPQGQFNLGTIYLLGLGVPKDYAKAASLLLKAADQGDSAAQINLAVMYAEGLGVPKDYVEALKWLLLAPRQINDPAVSMPARGAPDISTAAKEGRDALKARMSKAQITEAEQRAREWKPRVRQ